MIWITVAFLLGAAAGWYLRLRWGGVIDGGLKRLKFIITP